MANRSSGVRTLVIALVSALILVGLILAAFFLFSGSKDSPGITLPEQTVSSTPTEAGSVEEGLFLEVTPENVLGVIATLSRPASYHQTLSLTTAWSDGSADRTAALYVSGGLLRADVTDGDTVRSCLSDGETAYLWYQDDNAVTSFELGNGVTLDDLMGIPTYEDILEAAPESVVDAGFVTLADLDNRSCVFAQISADGFLDSYWVDVSTGLLCRADSVSGETLIYQLREVSSETLLASDELFTGAFTLPDGTAPFSSEQ